MKFVSKQLFEVKELDVCGSLVLSNSVTNVDLSILHTFSCVFIGCGMVPGN